MNGQCEMEGCREAAAGSWFAQWTIADFMDVEACQKHSATVAQWLWGRIIEDEELQDLVWTNYETPSLPT
jgi:hypothetical protein